MTPNGPSRLSERVGQIDWEKAGRLAFEAEEERHRAERARRNRDAIEAGNRLWAERGSRYRECRFETFVLATETQKEAVRQLVEYARNMRHYARGGMGIVLIGPPGTGKDHLMAALMHKAIGKQFIVKWTSGLRLFRHLRDAIDKSTSEADMFREYTRPDILAISDPTWERRPLTDFQQARLGEIVDERWSNRRPIWVTVNAEGPEDAERMLGHALVDRLRDGALSLACNWGSYRKSVTKLEAVGTGDE
jgi:DNA replication protein DnaC